MEILKSDAQILISALNIQDSERVVFVKEEHVSDANFILTHFMKQIFQDSNKALCLVLFHNTLTHYQNIGKRLNYNLQEKIKLNCVSVLEPLKPLIHNIENNECQFNDTSENVAKKLYINIETHLIELLAKMTGIIYVLFDDLSYIMELGVNLVHVNNFINNLMNFNDRVNLFINAHITKTSNDYVLSNSLMYISDVWIIVDSLKTGRSMYVSGSMTIVRYGKTEETHHFHATTNGIKIFKPGESIHRLHSIHL